MPHLTPRYILPVSEGCIAEEISPCVPFSHLVVRSEATEQLLFAVGAIVSMTKKKPLNVISTKPPQQKVAAVHGEISKKVL